MWRVGELLHLQQLPALQQFCRLHTVLAWGRNLEGQAAVEGAPLVLRPTPVLELHGMQLESLAAGKLTSAAVARSGELYTWGDGCAGKLGHGSGHSLLSPTRVEALVSRAHVAAVCLGDYHTIITDSQGGLWACGDNKEGQCGLGTPINMLARYRELAQDEAAAFLLTFTRHNPPIHWAASTHASVTAAAAADASAASDGYAQATQGIQAPTARIVRPRVQHKRARPDSVWARHSPLWSVHQHAAAEAASGGAQAGDLAVGGSSYGGASGNVGGFGGLHSVLAWDGTDLAGRLSAMGAKPGHQMVPARLGRDQHPLVQQQPSDADTLELHAEILAADLDPDEVQQGHFFNTTTQAWRYDDSWAMSEPMGEGAPGPQGIGGRRVVSVASSRHFSLAADAQGQVWSWGECFQGSLGARHCWITAAQTVEGQLAQTLHQEGGATAVAAGGTFGVALTRSGKVVVWGSLPAAAGKRCARSATMFPLSPSKRHSHFQFQGFLASPVLHSSAKGVVSKGHERVAAGVVPGLPRITHIAAGYQHVVLSDGQRVWVLGTTLSPGGETVVSTPWDAPVEVLDLGQAGVRSVSSGRLCSAVVSGQGELWMWGKLLNAPAVRAWGVVLGCADMTRRRQRSAGGPALRGPVPWEDKEAWQWAGFGAAHPTRVEGLPHNVLDVALGGFHALALVE